MKPYFPGGRKGVGTHGGPQYGKHPQHRPGGPHPGSVPPPTTSPTTPLAVMAAAKNRIAAGDLHGGLEMLEAPVVRAAEEERHALTDHVLALCLIMAYETNDGIATESAAGRITESRQAAIFEHIIPYAKQVAEDLAAKEKKGGLSQIDRVHLGDRTAKDFAAIVARQEEVIIGAKTVPDSPKAAAAPSVPKSQEPPAPAKPVIPPVPRPQEPPAPQPIRVTQAGVTPRQDDTNSRAAALLRLAEDADREGNEGKRSDLLRNRFAPLVAGITDPELLARARRLIKRTGDVVPELALPAAKPVTVTAGGAKITTEPIPAPPPPAPPPIVPKPIPSLDPLLQARIEPFLRSGRGRLGAKDYLGAIPPLKQVLSIVPDHPEARAGLNTCAASLLSNAEKTYQGGQGRGGLAQEQAAKGAASILTKQVMLATPTDPEVLARARTLAQKVGVNIPELTPPAPPPPPEKPTEPVAPAIDHELEALRAAVAATPNNIPALNDLAKALAQRKQKDAALEVLSQAQALSPIERDTLFTAIVVYSHLGQEEDCLRACVLFINLYDRPAYVITRLGFYFLHIGDELHARGAFEYVLQCEPGNKSAQVGLAQLRGPIPEERPIIGEVIAKAKHIVQTWEAESKGTKVQLLLRAAREALGQGKEVEAIEKFLEAKELDPKNTATTKELGVLFSKIRSRALTAKEEGRLQDAKTACELAMRIRPDDSQMQVLRGDIDRKISASARQAETSAAAALAASPAAGATQPPKKEGKPQPTAEELKAKAEESRLGRLFDYAQRQLTEGKAADAIVACQSILRASPSHAGATALLAQAQAATTPTPPAPEAAAHAKAKGKGGHPPLTPAEIEERRQRVITYLLEGDHLNIPSDQLPHTIHGWAFNKRMFPKGLRQAREEARQVKEAATPSGTAAATTPTPAPEPAPAPIPAAEAIEAPAEASVTASITKTRKPRDPSHHRPAKPPLEPAEVARRRAEVIAYLAEGNNVGLPATQLLVANSRVYWGAYDERLFPGKLPEAREAARAAKKTT